MSLRFKNSQLEVAPADSSETVAALVKMLSGTGIDRSRIDAIIKKSARPVSEARPALKEEAANNSEPADVVRRSA